MLDKANVVNILWVSHPGLMVSKQSIPPVIGLIFTRNTIHVALCLIKLRLLNLNKTKNLNLDFYYTSIVWLTVKVPQTSWQLASSFSLSDQRLPWGIVRLLSILGYCPPLCLLLFYSCTRLYL